MTHRKHFPLDLLNPTKFPQDKDRVEAFVELFNTLFDTNFSFLSLGNLVSRIVQDPKKLEELYTHPVVAMPTHVKVEVPDLRQGAAVTVSFHHVAPSKPYTLMLVCEVGDRFVVNTWLYSSAVGIHIQHLAHAPLMAEA